MQREGLGVVYTQFVYGMCTPQCQFWAWLSWRTVTRVGQTGIFAFWHPMCVWLILSVQRDQFDDGPSLVHRCWWWRMMCRLLTGPPWNLSCLWMVVLHSDRQHLGCWFVVRSLFLELPALCRAWTTVRSGFAGICTIYQSFCNSTLVLRLQEE